MMDLRVHLALAAGTGLKSIQMILIKFWSYFNAHFWCNYWHFHRVGLLSHCPAALHFAQESRKLIRLPHRRLSLAKMLTGRKINRLHKFLNPSIC
jgi:hypothetical protein